MKKNTKRTPAKKAASYNIEKAIKSKNYLMLRSGVAIVSVLLSFFLRKRGMAPVYYFTPLVFAVGVLAPELKLPSIGLAAATTVVSAIVHAVWALSHLAHGVLGTPKIELIY